MEAEEITKLVDGVYRNILDKFNPGARQLIAAGKSYLKALHGAASASRLFNEALAKIAMNAQQSGTGDIGSALMSVVNVNKEIQDQQMNILKAFYVDLLVPLETNLEKDTKVVQHEQKKFLQQHKVRMESYQKAVTTMKKQRKKKATPENTEKELRSIQLLEDQKKKLDVFCDQSYKNAMTQERRRYGFVLERQCSIAKHWMAYHTTGKTVIDNNFENWQEIAASREIIPLTAYETNTNNNNNSSNNSNNNGNNNSAMGRRLERIKDVEEQTNGSSQLKKSRSIDAPYGDMRTLHEREIITGGSGGGRGAHYAQNSLPRAKSDFNLTHVGAVGPSSAHKQHNNLSNVHERGGQWGDQRPLVKALYAYMPSGENQLPFEEGDRIALVGGKAKGWQFGENLRTQHFGWFPVAYTNAGGDSDGGGSGGGSGGNKKLLSHERYENMHYERSGGGMMRSYQQHNHHDQYMMTESQLLTELESDSSYRRRNHSAEESSSPTRMFGDTIKQHQKKYRPISSANPRPGPPPTLPAPVPNGGAGGNRSMLNSSQSFCATNGVPAAVERRKQKLLNGAQGGSSNATSNGKSSAAAKTSLHSSNDSGFSNEPPPQPEVDYSDEEPTQRVPIRRRADTSNSHTQSVPREVASWTLSRNFRNSVDSQIDDKSLHRLSRQSVGGGGRGGGGGIGGGGGKMRYDLIASDDEILQASSAGLKRTKSFWKFGGGRSGEDILAGMSLWQHRDLVAAPNFEEMRDEEQQRQQRGANNEEATTATTIANGTLTKSHNSGSSSHEKRRKDSITSSTEIYGGGNSNNHNNNIADDDENIYGMSPVTRQEQQHQQHQQQQRSGYTPKSRMKIMKTIEIDIEQPTTESEQRLTNTIKRSTQYKQQSLQTQQSQHKSQTLQRSKKATHSTDDDDDDDDDDVDDDVDDVRDVGRRQNEESDDHGTLKLSDVNNFFDDMQHDGNGRDKNGSHGLVMKTVKRKDILKQYYSSEDESDADAELKSTSSDPYDCIVINDHLVRKDDKLRRHQLQQQQQQHQQQQQLDFQTFRSSTSTQHNTTTSTSTLKKSNKEQQMRKEQSDNNNSSSTLTRNSTSNSAGAPTATILPRTRLLKSSSSSNNHNNSTTLERNSKSHVPNKTYGPWYDFWDQDQQQQHHHHGITSSQKMMMTSAAKMK